jgi:hypothetical protein
VRIFHLDILFSIEQHADALAAEFDAQDMPGMVTPAVQPGGAAPLPYSSKLSDAPKELTLIAMAIAALSCFMD